MLEIISSTVLMLPGERAGEGVVNRSPTIRARTAFEYWDIHRADIARVVASGLVAVSYLKSKRVPHWLIQEVERAQTQELFIPAAATMAQEKKWVIDETNPLYIVACLEQFRTVQPQAEQAFNVSPDVIRIIQSPE